MFVTALSPATDDGRFLTRVSPRTGATSQLEIQEVDGDAAPLLLGLLPFTYHGAEATHASVTGLVDLHNGVNLSENHYLRLQVDRQHLAEVDMPSTATTLEDIKKAINDALGIDVASHDGHFLKLTSPNTGISSSLTLLSAAAPAIQKLVFFFPGPPRQEGEKRRGNSSTPCTPTNLYACFSF